MDYVYENSYIFDEWPELEFDEELESNVFYEKKTKTQFSFVISKNEAINPPFNLSMVLDDAKDIPHFVGIIICVKSMKEQCDQQLYTHNYLNFTNESRSLSIDFPNIIFNETEESIAHYKDIWQDNQIQIFFKVKHWTSLPFSRLNTESGDLTRFSTLMTEHSTCYLNSIISILFNIPAFRNLIYSSPESVYPTVNKTISSDLNKNLEINPPNDSLINRSSSVYTDDLTLKTKQKSGGYNMKCVRSNSMKMYNNFHKNSEEHTIFPIVPALQRLFAMMENPYSCSTRVLTDSFGWPEKALDIQHDAQEFLCQFFDKLKERLPPTVLPRFIELFYGMERVNNVTKDENGNEKVEVSDHEFNMLQIIEISECKNLDNGLKSYFKDYVINSNTIINHRLVKLPKIFSFHICRFDNANSKNSSYFSYSRHINMTKYMVSSNKNEKILPPPNYLYRLLAVVVHKGDVNRGHYYSYICPYVDVKWAKFDDSRSNFVQNLNDVFRNNFGTSNKTKSFCPTAYILMYVRLDCIEEVMQSPCKPPVSAHDYATKAIRKAQRTNKDTNENQIIEVIDKEGLIKAIESGSSKNFSSVIPLMVLSLKEKTTKKEIYQKVNEKLIKRNKNKDDNNGEIKFKLWECDDKRFPKYFVAYNDENKADYFSKLRSCLYIEFTDESITKISSTQIAQDFNYIFFIYFDPLSSIKEHKKLDRFKYLFAIQVEKNDAITKNYKEIMDQIKQLNLISKDDEPQLRFYREESENYFCEVRQNYTFFDNRIPIGSFVYVQAFTDKREPDFSLPSAVPNYLNSLNQIDNKNETDTEKGGTEVSLFNTMNYEFPLSLTNIFLMFKNSLRFNVFKFGYMNDDNFYSIRVPGQMKLVDFKKYLAKVLGEKLNTMDREDNVQIFKVPRLKTPMTVTIANNPNQTIEIKNLFDRIQQNMNFSNDTIYSIDGESYDSIDEEQDIDLIHDIYVQIDHNYSSKSFFKRVSFSVDGILPTFLFQLMIPNDDYTVEDLFNNILAPKLISIVLDETNKDYNSHDFTIIRQLIESQTVDGKPNLKYDPTILRVLRFHNMIINNENLNVKTKLRRTDVQNQEIRFEIIPEEQKTSPLISVALTAPFASAVATGAGHPFLMSVDGNEDEIKQRLDNILNKALMKEELQSKEKIIEFSFGKITGELIPISRIEKLNQNIVHSNDVSTSESSSMENLVYEKNKGEIIENIKIAQNNKYSLFVIINGLNPNNFCAVSDLFNVLKIFN